MALSTGQKLANHIYKGIKAGELSSAQDIYEILCEYMEDHEINSTIKKSLEEDGKYIVRGVGTILIKRLKAKNCINPVTMEKMKVGERKGVKIVISRSFKKEINS